METVRALTQNFHFNIGNLPFSVPYVQAGVVVFLLFILVLSLAQLRRHFFDWSVKGAAFGLFMGFLLALVLEGFLIVGGKTAITELLGWKEAPKPVANILEVGRKKLVQVLGVQNEIPRSVAKLNPTFEEALSVFQSLNPSESGKLKKIICQP